jgi:hypothetical protein
MALCEGSEARRGAFIRRTDDGVLCPDGLAERSKALDLGSSPKGRGFKSHSRQEGQKGFFLLVSALVLHLRCITF